MSEKLQTLVNINKKAVLTIFGVRMKNCGHSKKAMKHDGKVQTVTELKALNAHLAMDIEL